MFRYDNSHVRTRFYGPVTENGAPDVFADRAAMNFVGSCIEELALNRAIYDELEERISALLLSTAQD